MFVDLVASLNLLAQGPKPKPEDPCNVAGCIPGILGGLGGKTAGQGLSNVIITIAQFLTFITASVAVLFIVWGTWRMVISRGESKEFSEGMSAIKNAILGLVISVGAYAFIAAIVEFLNSAVFK